MTRLRFMSLVTAAYVAVAFALSGLRGGMVVLAFCILPYGVVAYRLVLLVCRRRGTAANGRIGGSFFGPSPICPGCGAPIHWPESAVCPGCGNAVQVRRSYSNVLTVISFVIAGLIAFGAGASGDAWLWMTLLGVCPTILVISVISLQMFPPDVEFSGDYRSVLFGREDSDTRGRPEPPGD